MKSKTLLLLCIFIWLVATLLYLKGFLPFDAIRHEKKASNHIEIINTNGDPPSRRETKQTWNSHKFDRLILLVIDALRVDFVYGNKERMPFLWHLMETGRAISFKANVMTPTVTLPRLKALVTGRIPGFVDVIMNFAASELKEDNLIKQLKNANKKILFYGDVSWTTLFPDSFLRSQDVDSYILHDFNKGDNSITDHLKDELKETDWDVLILHYPGLDHIGHIYGPSSSLIGPKLLEMDGVIQMMYKSILESDKRTNLSSVIVTCGDHGMANAGGHGGASIEETTTPLIFISSKYDYSNVPSKVREVDQVDIAPSLALLLGIDIPKKSIGVLIPELLKSWTIGEQVESYSRNTEQFLEVYGKDEKSIDLLSKLKLDFKTGKLNHSDESFKQLHRRVDTLSDKLQSKACNYTKSFMIIGIALNGVSLCLAFWVFYRKYSDKSSKLLGEAANDDQKRKNDNCLLENISDGTFALMPINHFVCVMFGLYTLALLSMASSSFIEEEHQVWYFIVTTTALLLFADQFKYSVNYLAQVPHPRKLGPQTEMNVTCKSKQCSVLPSCNSGVASCSSQENVAGVKIGRGFDYGRRATNITAPSSLSCYMIFSPHNFLLMFILLRVVRVWNQTGVKWSFRADVGDWLLEDNQSNALLSLVLLSFILNTAMAFKSTSVGSFTLFIIGQCSVFAYHAKSGILADKFGIPKRRGIPEARLTYLCIVLLMVGPEFMRTFCYTVGIRDSSKSEQVQNNLVLNRILLSLQLLILLLSKCQNIILSSLAFLLEKCILQTVTRRASTNPPSPFEAPLLYFAVGKAIFYAQGNSNSLSTVDVAAGLIGAEDYYPILGFWHTTMATFGGFLYCCVASLQLKQQRRSNGQKPWMESAFSFLLLQQTEAFFYYILVYFQRYHLFIWSVFAPKLLYNMMFSLVLYAFAIITYPVL